MPLPQQSTLPDLVSPHDLNRGHRALLSAMFLFQFFHWFKPSQAYFADFVLPHYHITSHMLINDVYAWDTIFQMAAAVLMIGTYMIVGGRHILVLCACAAVATVASVLASEQLSMLVVSQFLWALSFTALFLVSGVLYQLIPLTHFQIVASVNNLAMLCASMSSSLAAYAWAELSPAMACGDASLSSYQQTFYVSLAAAVLSLFVIVAAPYMGYLPASDATQDCCKMWHCFIAETRANLSSSKLLAWVSVSAITRGVHTQVETLWSLISLDIVPGCWEQRFNPLISFAAYLGAAVVVVIPAWFPNSTAAHGHLLVAPCLLACSAALFLAGEAQSLLFLGILLVVYHSCCELLLTVASAQIARAALEADAATRLTEGPIRGSDDGVQYMSAMVSKYMGSLLVETVLMLTVWPRWGGLENVFGLDLSVRKQMQGLACALCAALLLVIAMRCKQMCARCVVQNMPVDEAQPSCLMRTP